MSEKVKIELGEFPAPTRAKVEQLQALRMQTTGGVWSNGPDEIQTLTNPLHPLFKVLSPPSGNFDEHMANGDFVTQMHAFAPGITESWLRMEAALRGMVCRCQIENDPSLMSAAALESGAVGERVGPKCPRCAALFGEKEVVD